MASLHTLPVELLETVFAELPVIALANARIVCRSWRELCDSTAIPIARRKLLELRKTLRADKCAAMIRSKIRPFLCNDFDRKAYIAQIETHTPAEFTTWVLETQLEDIIGWHWPGLRNEHNRDRFEELGIDWIDAMAFSRHMKPGYTLLPLAKVMEVEDPDYSEYNNTDLTYYPGSWQCQRPLKEHRVKALQIWVDLSASTPKITFLILSGSERWDGTVWLTETRAPYRHSVESMNQGVQLVWMQPVGSWTEYLKAECKSLQENYLTHPQYKSYRSGGRVWMREAH